MSADITFNDAKKVHNILVVEDDAPDMALARMRLKAFWPDCNVIAVNSLRRAHNEFKQKKFDLVLLDLNLIDAYGPDTVQQIRKLDIRVPIIVMTGFLTPITANESLKLGANNIVSKSQIMQDEFFEILQKNTAA